MARDSFLKSHILHDLLDRYRETIPDNWHGPKPQGAIGAPKAFSRQLIGLTRYVNRAKFLRALTCEAEEEVVKEDLRVSALKKRKGNDRTFYPFTNKTLSDCMLGKVLVEEGDEVERGQTLYIVGQRKPYVWNPSISTCIPTESELTIKKTLRRNRKSSVGIFSMEDVLVDHGHSHQMEGLDNEEDVLKRYQNFNKFDTVVDHSDHFFSAESCAMNQPPQEWADKIRDEWRSLAENVPETIFLRVYENRMDLLRDVIIEPTWTPYHNGLFFSYVCFPSNYPDSPPLVTLVVLVSIQICTSVVRFNLAFPNRALARRQCGFLAVKTILQLLVSIQDCILNKDPLFNDITYAIMSSMENSFHIFTIRIPS
nr:hypothetical protein [Tanacetum cinerariifolium]